MTLYSVLAAKCYWHFSVNKYKTNKINTFFMQTILLFISLTICSSRNMSEPRTHTVRLSIIYNGHNARLMHDPVCHCNHLFLDYNSRPSKLVCTSVTLASFIQLRDVVCVSYDTRFWATVQSVLHTMRNVLLRNPEYLERWYCYLLIGYIFFYMT